MGVWEVSGVTRRALENKEEGKVWTKGKKKNKGPVEIHRGGSGGKKPKRKILAGETLPGREMIGGWGV